MLTNQKSLTLIEIIVAVTIFSILSVCLYSLFRSGLSLRRKLQTEQEQIYRIYLNFDNIARQMRNSIKWQINNSGFRGSEDSVEFYSVLFDYPEDYAQIYRINYTVQDGSLVKKISIPFQNSADSVKEFKYINDLEYLRFSYYGSDSDDWKDKWPGTEQGDALPLGVKIDLKYSPHTGNSIMFHKSVFIRSD